MSQSAKTGVIECGRDCLGWGKSCPGHEVTVIHNKTVDVVTVQIKRGGSDTFEYVQTFDDPVFAEIVRLWSAPE